MDPDTQGNSAMRTLMNYLAHIDEIDHNQSKSKEELEALIGGSARFLDSNSHLNAFLEIPLEFGSFLGPNLTVLILERDGTIAGIHHDNESSWSIHNSKLILHSSDGSPTTTFNLALFHNRLQWVLGRFNDGRTVHYLTPARHRRPPMPHLHKVFLP